jgi:ABC-type branched-subunit amino acid transport system substrate-binding protein
MSRFFVWIWIGALAAPAAAQDASRRASDPYGGFRAPADWRVGKDRPETIAIGMVTTRDDLWKPSRIRGASLGVEEANRQGGWDDVPFALLLGEVDNPWSAGANIVRDLIYRGGCSALVTPPDRATSHQMETVVFRAHVPLVSLSDDSSLSRIPYPWFVRAVLDVRAEVTLLVESLGEKPEGPIPAIVPDARVGRAIRLDLGSVSREQGVSFDPVLPFGPESKVEDLACLQDHARGPVLVWLGPEQASRALPMLASLGWQGDVLVSRSLFEGDPEAMEIPEGIRCKAVRLFSEEGEDAEQFARLFRDAYGEEPDEAAAAAYDAVCLITRAIRDVGPSRSAIREYFARRTEHAGATGEIVIDGFGNRRASVDRMKVVERGRGAAETPIGREESTGVPEKEGACPPTLGSSSESRTPSPQSTFEGEEASRRRTFGFSLEEETEGEGEGGG